MWRDIEHKQLKDCYEMNKITKEVRSKPYELYKGEELTEVGYTYVKRNPDNGKMYLNHHSQYSWFSVDNLWERTFK